MTQPKSKACYLIANTTEMNMNMNILLNSILFIVLMSSLHAKAASRYVADRLKCSHTSYLINEDGRRRKVSESNFEARVGFYANRSSYEYSIDRYRFSPRISYTRAMEQLNPSLPTSAPTTDRVRVGPFTTNSLAARVSSQNMNLNRGRSYGSTIIREKVAVSIDATSISITVRERLTERWVDDSTYIRNVTCKFSNSEEAVKFMNATI